MRIQRALLSISLLAALLALPHPAASAEEQAAAAARMAAIVIDDLGNNMAGTEEIVGMPFPITVAVMPFLPSSQKDAEAAHRNGHEVIVHLPMEPLKGNKSWLGPGAITCDLSDDEIRKRVHAAIDDIPHAIGINNHMGSKATVDERVMRVVLEVCRERGLFFLDSHTNYRSIVSKLAKQIGVPCIENHLFLDDVKSKMHVLNQIKLLQKHLREHEPCIAIGHVGSGGKITAELVRQLPGTMENVQFVGVSKLVR
ncbi:divergent polysaccharide deacetylase family protein [Paenibacillus oceani]|uniref:Divergent polysaccharide deacetylase family protein n=1 Tax=Paenibacillus oceani TaxID=2772510 RepID=A0A927CEU4_9BACL|nr:divergent polysaccharide deacetylase family protein [Paenibacillus oceani]MBD2865617.1 divergent polysaccharide deacetylase family protein [Paenibacillus oceani]